MKVEDELLAIVRRRLGAGLLGPGDDVDFIKVGDYRLVFNVDGFSAKGVLLEFMDLRDVGWRGVTACVSDLVAKLVKPKYFLHSVYGSDVEEVREIVEGIVEAAEEYGLAFLGADTNKGEAAVDVFCFGLSDLDPPRLGGARPGDKVVVPEGCWGCINRCLRGEYWEHCKRPKVPLELLERLRGYEKYVHASTDSSDGLVISLYKLAWASGVTIALHEPPPGPLGEEGLYGGEEYLPVFVVDPSASEAVEEAVKGRAIGEVLPGRPEVVYKGRTLDPRGWEWF
ncbi:thiamine-phosphate kinase [Ignicoccus hospitalis]|uniref:AIR synthase related protein domain protein n=1 Tax=Ignicoccus hospitalis (strain KIN4/I / DSM 18386 / JCM 14125) TaxID=453591 RepID=A8A901_IGNH4|nr:thiamine-phosphate kinase [Ignicoccus hospitalis]ABU81403.1 AIR synthase related protein domain protein [Ignicoccus hospitalis KIN4/I]HIH90290.1 thiamine-monophosphate kinase [Desulfurococcaceae archaeon]